MLETERLILRRWSAADLAPFAALNADSEVMAHFPALLSRAESDDLVERFEAAFDERGFAPWALEVKVTGSFIGYTGLMHQSFPAHFTPAVEVGWRLQRSAWGHGYASEAARAALDYGFDVLDLDEIVSMTAVSNTRSQRVMQRLGMTRDPADDFLHPNVPDDSPIKPHVLYRISRGAR